MTSSDNNRPGEVERKHCRDIPDRPVLQFLALLEDAKITSCHTQGGELVAWQPSTGTIHEGFANSILNAVPYGAAYPDKLRREKIKSMVRRGLISGCTCGCRGDFELTEKGRAALAQQEKTDVE